MSRLLKMSRAFRSGTTLLSNLKTGRNNQTRLLRKNIHVPSTSVRLVFLSLK